MNKRLLYLMIICILALGLQACKKDNSNSATLIGTWELEKIHLSETNKTYPLDSFRNVISAKLTFNSDSSFAKTDNFGRVQLTPLASGLPFLQELYDAPRHPKARFIIYKGYEELPVTSSKFSVQEDIIHFETEYKDANTIRSNKVLRQFELKRNAELEIHHENFLIYNQQSNSFLGTKIKFIYKRKSF